MARFTRLLPPALAAVAFSSTASLAAGNAAPVVPATVIAVTVAPGAKASGIPIGATDPDGDTLSYSPVTGATPTQGTVVYDAAGGTFSYTPKAGVTAARDRFMIRVEDGKGGLRFRAVTVAIGTISNGTKAANTLVGGPGNDVIRGKGGNDKLYGDPEPTAASFELVSVTKDGGVGEKASFDPVYSPDGTKVAFASGSNNLSSDVLAGQHILVKDLWTGELAVASAGQNGYADASSASPAFSPDGLKLVFASDASNLAGGGMGTTDIFVKDLVSGEIDLVTKNAAGVAADGNSGEPSFSPDGKSVVFASGANNLAGGAAATYDVFIADLASGAVKLVSADENGMAAAAGSGQPTFAPDGRSVLFTSYADNLAGGMANTNDVFLKNLETGAVTLLSANGAAAANKHSFNPSFSHDGMRVIFDSEATNFPGLPTGATSGIYIRVLAGTGLVQVAGAPDGDSGQYYFDPRFSMDDKKVVYLYETDGLNGKIGDNYYHVAVRDLDTGAMSLITKVGSGVADDDSHNPRFSPDGASVLFDSDAANLAGGAPGNLTDVFIAHLPTTPAGDDVLYGGSGNDRIFGGGGDDVILGDKGADRLSGGEGKDRFVYRKVSDSQTTKKTRDVILDFKGGQGDRIDLSAVDAKAGVKGRQHFKWIGQRAFSGKKGELRFKKGLLSGDTNGDRKADFSIKLKGVGKLKKKYLILK